MKHILTTVMNSRSVQLMPLLTETSLMAVSLLLETSHGRNIYGLKHLLLSPQGTPAALMHEAFGGFLDDASSASLDKHTCKAIMDLIESMSASYANTSTKADLAILKKLFGAAHKGRSRGT